MPKLLKPGDFFGAGRYELKKQLGEGGFALVFSGIDHQAEGGLKRVVLKTPLTESGAASLKNEVKLLKGLRHHNIITFYDYFEDEDGRIFYLMEFVEGAKSLDKLGQSGQELSIAEILLIAQQAAEALYYLHTNKIAHLDLKPANWLYQRQDGQLRLLDFGIARYLPEGKLEIKSEVIRLGTPPYQPPEYRGGGPVTLEGFKSDIYALGLILYELLVQEAYRDNTQDLRMRENGQVGNIPEKLADLVMRMLDAEQAKRPDAGQICSELAKLEVVESNRLRRNLPLVGRGSEWASLIKKLTECEKGHGDLLLISGPAGIGKSRLSAQLEEEARHRGYFTAFARWQGSDLRPYFPLVRILQAILAHLNLPASALELNTLVRLLPEISYSGSGPLPPANPAALEPSGQLELLEVLLALLQRLSVENPILIYLDNAHQFDRHLLRLLSLLKPLLEQLPILLCLTYRINESSDQERLKEVFNVLQLELGGLEVPQLEILLLEVFGGERDHEDYLNKLADLIHHKTLGYPIFVESILRLLHTFSLTEIPNHWRFLYDTFKKIPALNEDTTERLTDTLLDLSSDEKTLVRLGATLGFSFRLDLLQNLYSQLNLLPAVSLNQLLGRLELAGIMVTDETGQIYAFRHDLFYQAARRQVDQELSDQVAPAVERYYKVALLDPIEDYIAGPEELPFKFERNDPLLLSLLLDCWEKSSGMRSIVGYALLLAEQALAAGANDQAKFFLETAQYQLEYTLDKNTLEDWEFLAEEGNLLAAKNIAFSRQSSLLTRTWFWTLKGLAQVSFNQSDNTRAVEIAEKAATLVNFAPSEAVTEQRLAELYDLWARALSLLRKHDQILRIASTPFIQAVRVEGAVLVRLYEALTYQRLGDISRNRKLGEEMLKLAEERNYYLAAVKAHNLLTIIERHESNLDSAMAHAKAAEELAKQFDYRYDLEVAQGAIAIIYFDLDNPELKEPWKYYAELGLRNIERGLITQPVRQIIGYNMMGEFYRRTGGPRERAEEYYQEALKVAREKGWEQLKPVTAVTWMNLGALYNDYIPPEKAGEPLEQAREIFESGADKTQLPEFYQHYARYRLNLQDREGGLRAYELAIKWAKELNNRAELGKASYELTGLYLAEGFRLQEAKELLKTGLDAWLQIPNSQNWGKKLRSRLAELCLLQAEKAATPEERTRLLSEATYWQNLLAT